MALPKGAKRINGKLVYASTGTPIECGWCNEQAAHAKTTQDHDEIFACADHLEDFRAS